MKNNVRLIDANSLKVRMFRSTGFNFETGSFDLPVVPWHDIEDADTIDAVPVMHAKWEKRYKMIVCAGMDGCFETLPWHFYTKKMCGGKLPA